MLQVPSYAALDGLPLSYGVASLLGAVAALCLCFAAMHIRRRRTGLTMRKKDVASPQASTSSSPRGLIKSGEHTAEGSTEPVSVNYHFLRSCNYSCGFCFHTATTSHIEPLNRAAHALQLLREAGCEKLNFSGGEPFLADSGKHVGELCRIAKQDFKYRSVSIVSNGSLITEEWFRQYAAYLDILAISCDSFDDKRNRQIGRVDRKSHHLPHADKLRLISQWCAAYDVRFKINTVVNKFNVDEDFTVPMQQLKPCRWKVFQCLEVDGENAGESAKRRAKEFLIPDEAFRSFVDAHRDSLRASGVPVVPEDNASMRASYIIMDEYLRFLDCSTGGKIPSKCILDVGVDEAMKQSGFDRRMFFHRGGYYPWHKSDNNSLVW